jgi:hypothetical protein
MCARRTAVTTGTCAEGTSCCHQVCSWAGKHSSIVEGGLTPTRPYTMCTVCNLNKAEPCRVLWDMHAYMQSLVATHLHGCCCSWPARSVQHSAAAPPGCTTAST